MGILNDLEHFLTVSHRYAVDDMDYKDFLRTAEVTLIWNFCFL